MIVLIDNYDSFTYNLYQLIGRLGETCLVLRNDQTGIQEIAALKPSGLVISPGPGGPESAGCSLQAIAAFAGIFPILGICLGHQAIGQAFGAKVTLAPQPVHGKTSLIYHDQKGIYGEIAEPFRAARYHSLMIDPQSLPSSLVLSSQTEDGVPMGVRHRDYPIEGVQFHPESCASEAGEAIVRSFLRQCQGSQDVA